MHSHYDPALKIFKLRPSPLVQPEKYQSAYGNKLALLECRMQTGHESICLRICSHPTSLLHGYLPLHCLFELRGRSIRTGNNCDENDFLNESYICFRRRGNKPVRKTRACQVVNNADKLAQLDQNVSHVLDIADALLVRENVKQAVAFPSLITKADEERLIDKPTKTKVSRNTDPGPPATASAGQAVLPSERCAAIQPEIMMQKESEEIKRDSEVDVVDVRSPRTPKFLSLLVMHSHNNADNRYQRLQQL
ncbi:hypothetical protein B0H14DRAFT_2654283 [Mycena olivaceomarginata]|nr:hypothetical protein B0H14DRAFT_2654283 [Mycena olivaceomarginata]